MRKTKIHLLKIQAKHLAEPLELSKEPWDFPEPWLKNTGLHYVPFAEQIVVF